MDKFTGNGKIIDIPTTILGRIVGSIHGEHDLNVSFSSTPRADINFYGLPIPIQHAGVILINGIPCYPVVVGNPNARFIEVVDI